MDPSDLISRYPRVYHMAVDGSWPAIQERGLLSTSALVDLYQPDEALRSEILTRVRRRSYVLERAGLPQVTVRDQLPLKFLEDSLFEGVSVQDFLQALNSRVFFWPDRGRLEGLMNARAYRRHPQVVLTLDTASLLRAHPDAELTPYNTGSVHVPRLPKRGPQTFRPIADYPFEEWSQRRGSKKKAIAELTVPWHVPSITGHVTMVERWEGGRPDAVLFRGRG